jgi:hypothetical protein
MSGIINSAGSKSGVIGFSGDIVAQGSNSNGSYIKFSSGVMHCWFDDSGYAATTSAWEDTFYKSSTINYTFPVAFNSAPVVSASVTSVAAYCWTVNEGHSATGTGIIAFSDRTTSTACLIKYSAIGTWK